MFANSIITYILFFTPGMFKRLLLFCFLLFIKFSLFAQSTLRFSGTVHDAKGKPIQGATIYLLNTNFRTSTGADGHFTIANIPSATYSVRISAVGYAALIKSVTISPSNLNIGITLADANKQLDEVLVTAQKTDEDPQKLPLSLSVISSKQVDDDKLWDTKDLTAIVPNLYASNSGDDRNVTSIRGVATTSYDQAVTTYVDGVNQFDLDTYIAQLEDIERIEVLRGPQGTLYGRGAMGGVINIITKQPDNEVRGFAEADYGNYNQQRYTLGLRAPLVKDKLFLGVSGLYTSQNGFYTNLYNNTKFDDQHSFLGNYYLKYLATSRLTLTLNVKNVENRNNGAFTLAADPAMALAQPFTVDQNATTTMVDNILNASLSVQYTGHWFNFTSQSAYQTDYRYYEQPIDGDFSPLDIVSIVNNYGKNYNKVKVGTQEFRFSSVASSKLKWVAGTYFFYQYDPNKQGTHFGADAADDGAPFPYFTDIATNISHNYGIAFYGQATYPVAPKLNATVGLRYDDEQDKESIEGEFQKDGQPAVVTRSDTASSAKFSAVSPKASLDYQFTTNDNVYALYSAGFRAGGITQLGSDPTQPPLLDYKPEHSNNFEIGTKNTFFNDRLKANFTVYYTEIYDVQVPTLVLPAAITIIRNAGKLNSKGAELELLLKPFDGFEAGYNLGTTDAKFTSLNLSSNGTSVNLDGNRQVFTPDMTSMLIVQYGYPIGNDGKTRLVAHGEWRYLGSQYFDLANTIEQKGYNLFNARLGVSTKKLDVFLWESNIFNKHYIDYAYDFGATHLGNPRTFGVSVRTNF
jgi:iron complex outermembrane recepter protein